MATVRQFTAWAEKRIAGLIVAEGLHVGLLGVTQGPLTITFKLRLLHPSPTALRKLLSLGPALQQALHCTGVRIAERPGYIALEIPSPIHRTPRSGELARASRGLSVCVGVDALRQPVQVDLRQHGALFWIGPSRRGKTQSMKSTLYALSRVNGARFRYAIFCHERKREDWGAFEQANGCMGIVTTAKEQEQALEWFAYDLLEQRTSHSFALVIDDLINLLSTADLSEGLANIASMGAGVGVHLLAGTQEAGSKRGTGGAGVENNATARILYRNSNAAAAARATGQGAQGVQQLSGAKGDALLLLDGEAQRIATGLADDRDILQLPQGEGWLRPWLQTTRQQPVTTTHNQRQPAQPPAPFPPTSTWVAATPEGNPQPVGVVAADYFPIEKREPTTQEVSAIQELYASGMSLNALCRTVYGHKDGKAYAYIKQALEEPAEPSDEAEQDVHIDMNTREGLAALEALQRSGVLRRDTITEVIRPQ